MQLADNPITKIILEKLKHKDFRNLNHLIFDEKRPSEQKLKRRILGW